VFPGDLRVRPIDPGPDDEPFVALVNDTFIDHPTPFRLDLAQLRRTHGRPDFDPGTILLVVEAGDPGRMMGFCRITRYEDDDGRPIGEVKHVGVRREHRGHGLGRALVRWGAAEVRRRGAGDVLLSVEGANDGALRLYESLGFKRGVEWRRWTWPPEGGSLGR
jgi:mycothiol synthase